MHPHASHVLSVLDKATSDLCAAIEAIPSPLRGRKPSPDRWSVDEVSEHLALVEQLFVGRLGDAIAAGRETAVGPDVADPQPLADRVHAMLRDRSNRRPAAETVHPVGQVGAAASVAMLGDLHRRIHEAIAAAGDLALSRVTMDHPVFGTLSVYQWIELIAGHEARHTAQIRELAGQLAAVS